MREILVILLFKLYFCDQIEADMIETFIIKNYRSYRDKTELSFVASNKEGGKKKTYLLFGLRRSMVSVYCVYSCV